MSADQPVNEELVSWKVDEIDVNASLIRPAGEGPFPAVIFVAGSGPTDRNWNTPLIPGSNGAGGLLARELSARGFITLRYDKRATGLHAAETVKLMEGKISMQGHVAELAGGVSLLASNKNVNPAKIFVLTNSEGCVHALNYQTQTENQPFAGMVLTSAFARPTGEMAHSQIAAQLSAVPGGDAMLEAYDAAMQDFVAGRPVHVDEKLPAGLQQVIQAVTLPLNQPFARELWVYNPAAKIAQVTVPVLMVFGKKDIQVDWQMDGPLFEAVAEGRDNITFFYADNANHVLKLELRPRAQLTAADAMTSYGADEVMLDPDPVEKIAAWLKAQL